MSSNLWFWLARFILRQRWTLLAVLLVLTALMAFQASRVRVSYHGNRLIPESDPDYLAYMDFCKRFGVDGNVMVVGLKAPSVTDPELMRNWVALSRKMRQIPGVDQCYTVADLPVLVRNDSLGRFDAVPCFADGRWTQGIPSGQDSYQRLLIRPQDSITLMAVALNPQALNDQRRLTIVQRIEQLAEAFAVSQGHQVYLSGLPYIRTVMATRIKDELVFFLIASALATALVLFLFFRSLQAVLLSMALVGIGTVWAMGFMHTMGYEISLISSLIPALMVVIGVPNGVYLVNKYHHEFRKHGNKVKALTRIVERIGIATLITNATTAIGFLVFCFTESSMLQEFGLVTGISVMWMFVLSLILIPAVLSLLPDPGFKQIKHLENQRIGRWLERLVFWIEFRRPVIWGVALCLLVVACTGILRLRTKSYVVDDLPQNDRVYTDLRLLEKHFGGVMPVDVVVDAGRPNRAPSPGVLQVADRIQDLIATEPVFGPPISLVELMKAGNQAYFGGAPSYYHLPNAQERAFVMPYLLRSRSEGQGQMTSRLMDSSKQFLRISYNMADVGTDSLQRVLNQMNRGVQELLKGRSEKVSFTGSSLIFLKGNQYLIRSLASSIFLAVALIAILMGLTYQSWKAVVFGLLPNIIPLLFTAGMMGWLGISIKPSTVLIFSIVLGIAVDDCIHYLARYFQEIRRHERSTLAHLKVCTRETGASMIYTSIILFFGFIVFAFSDFGGTRALGIMSAVTLLLAMMANLMLLPALILWMEGWKGKTVKKPLGQG